MKHIHFYLLGHGLTPIHTDNLNDIHLQRMGICAITDPSKLKIDDLIRISRTETL